MTYVTCHTAGCTNAGVAIDVNTTYPDPETGDPVPVDAVVCGVCGHPIDDLQEET